MKLPRMGRFGESARAARGGAAPVPSELFQREGRPKAEREPILWIPVAIRVMALAWAAVIVSALLEVLGVIPYGALAAALSMTALFVGATFLWTNTRDYVEDVPLNEGAMDESEQDLLTELPTFPHFSRRLGDEFARARRMGRRIAIVLIDVNNLTAVNKEYGVRAGDEVLRHVAKAAEATKRYNDIVARLGDDEFGVILLDTGSEGVDAFIERLEERLARDAATAEVQGRSVSLWAGVCSGSAVSSPEMTRPEAVLEGAMASLNQAKQDRERRRRMWLSA